MYPDKRVHYTDEYKNDLKQFCEKNGYDVSYKSIFKELQSALSYDLNYRNIPYKDIVEFNNRAKKLINDFKQRLK